MLHKRSLVVGWHTRTKTEAYREVEVPLSQGVVGLQEGATLGGLKFGDCIVSPGSPIVKAYLANTVLPTGQGSLHSCRYC